MATAASSLKHARPLLRPSAVHGVCEGGGAMRRTLPAGLYPEPYASVRFSLAARVEMAARGGAVRDSAALSFDRGSAAPLVFAEAAFAAEVLPTEVLAAQVLDDSEAAVSALATALTVAR